MSMIAIYPPVDVAAALAVPGGELAEDLHITVAYTGPDDELGDNGTRIIFGRAVAAAGWRTPFRVRFGGIARFDAPDENGNQPIVALVDSPELTDLAASLCDDLAYALDSERTHGYTAHITLAYAPPDAPLPEVEPFEFDVTALTVVLGDGRTPLPLVVEPEIVEVTETVADQLDGRLVEAVATTTGHVFRCQIIEAGMSRNRKRYPLSVLHAAAPLYEGVKAFDGHRPDLELVTSRIENLVGHWRNVTPNATGIEGDLHLLPSAQLIAEALEASLDAQASGLPPVVGISHDTETMTRIVGGVTEATQIVRVLSVDVVADPAAGGKAVRMVAGGLSADDISASPNSPEKEHPDMSLAEILASATDEDKAALRALLGDAPTATDSPEPEPQPVDEPEPELVAAGRESLFVRGLVREAMADAKLDAGHTAAVTALLPERVSEADISRAVAVVRATVQKVAEGVEKSGLTPSATQQIRVGQEDGDKARERLYQTLCRNWREGFTSIYAAYEAITGRRLNPYDPDDVRALVRESWAPSRMGHRVSEAISSSTFGEALGDSITRRLIDMYRGARYGSWRSIASTVPVRDFRTQRRDRIGGYGNLPAVAEGGTYQPLTSPTDEEATYAVTKRGGTESWTFESAMNDDLGALARIPEELGRAAARTLHEFVWLDNFASNPTCTYDSVALFDAGHANTTAAALSNANASALRALMRTQAGYGVASKPLGVTPRFLVVPNELEDLANQICNGDRAVPATTPGATDVPNLHRGTELIVVDEFTDANDWYMVADPADVPLIEIGFLGGREEPELFMQDDPTQGTPFSSDEVTYKIRHIYSGAVIDHRAAQRGTQ